MAKNSPITDGKTDTVHGTAALQPAARETADPDIPILSDDDLKEAEDEGKKRDKSRALTIARSEQI